MEPINIPGMAAVVRRRQAMLRTSGLVDDGTDNERPAIEGLAHSYLSLFELNDELQTLVPGCSGKSLSSGKRIRLLVDHDPENEMACSRTGLSVAEANDGLLFSIDVSRTKNPNALLGIVGSANRQRVSIGYRSIKSELHRCGAYDVRFNTEIELEEISLVKAGRSKPAFVHVTDRSKFAAPTAHSRSLDFALSHACYRIGKAARAIDGIYKEQAATLNTRLDRIAAEIEPAPLDVSGLQAALAKLRR